MSKRSNILVIFNDDHAQWASGAYGNKELKTPNIDYLAATGVQMMNAFTPTPVCSPARACFFTGRLASQHGVHDYLSDSDPEVHYRDWLADEIILPQILQGTGYQTGMIGKWHLGQTETAHRGFDHWFTLGGGYPMKHDGPYRFVDNGQEQILSGTKTGIITEAAINFLRQRDEERPFFLYVGYLATHSPWSGHPERLVNQYRNGSFDDIPNDEIYPFGAQALESMTVNRGSTEENLAQYYASVSQIDEGTGQLLDELEALDLRDDTLVVYTSDHGLNCGHHGIWGKGNGTFPLNMVEESIRVPLIFNHPEELFPGQRRSEMVDHLDLFQTIAAYAGASLPEELSGSYPGCSFLPMLTNSGPFFQWRDVQFGEYGNLRMIRTHTHKLIRRYPDGPDALFNLQTDPRETRNLIEDPNHQHVLRQLTDRLETHFSQFEDPVKSGLRVCDLPHHNQTEAWRSAGEVPQPIGVRMQEN